MEAYPSAGCPRIGKQKTESRSEIREIAEYIDKNFAFPITLSGLAANFGYSPNYFSSLFHKIVGVSFREHLCRVRVEESKHLLLSTDYSITDIAVAMGFPDQSYYCKVFKNVVGVTPGKFRS